MEGRREGEGITGIITVKQGVVFSIKDAHCTLFIQGVTCKLFSSPPFHRGDFIRGAKEIILATELKRHVTVMIRRRDYYMDEFLVSSSFSSFFFSFNFDIVG